MQNEDVSKDLNVEYDPQLYAPHQCILLSIFVFIFVVLLSSPLVNHLVSSNFFIHVTNIKFVWNQE